jgi:drug/metabolite transporter (DMT)-like permease
MCNKVYPTSILRSADSRERSFSISPFLAATFWLQDLSWLGAAILAGVVVAPVLLLFGLRLTPASSASLLLNLEGVLTALLAWSVFKENFDRRICLGMLAIFAGGVLLSWQSQLTLGVPWGPLGICGACLCWAIDNNLTRKVSAVPAPSAHSRLYRIAI